MEPAHFTGKGLDEPALIAQAEWRRMVREIRTLRRLLRGTEAVIFDFDNILVDSEPFHFEAYNTVFAKRGHALDRSEYWREWTSKGGGAEGEIARHGLAMDPDEIRREKDPIYSEFCRTTIEMFPAAKGILGSLAKGGYTLAIASGSYERDIRSILASNGIEHLFSAIVGKDGIGRTKPDPETYLKAVSLLGLPSASCLAVEDAQKGVASARGAGMHVIVVETDLTRGFDFTGADLVLRNLDEFAALLAEVLTGA